MEELGTLIRQLESGVRMEMPRSSPIEVTQLVDICWETDPANRPTFAQLEHMLGELMDESVRNYYIDMNEPYHRRNIERFGDFTTVDDEAANSKEPPTHPGYVNV